MLAGQCAVLAIGGVASGLIAGASLGFLAHALAAAASRQGDTYDRLERNLEQTADRYSNYKLPEQWQPPE